jgi:hypothetical protein
LLENFKGDTPGDVDKSIKLLKSMFEMIASEIGLTMDEVDDYIHQLIIMQDAKVCDNYTMNIDLANKLDVLDPSSVSVKSFLETFQCTTCKCFMDHHVSCNKFVRPDDNNMCATCGLQSDKHTICDAFVASIDGANCECCGRSSSAHRSKKRETVKCCDTYKKSDIAGDCEHCSYGNGEHLYNET